MRTLSASTALVTGACLLVLALAQLIGAQPTAAAGVPPAGAVVCRSSRPRPDGGTGVPSAPAASATSAEEGRRPVASKRPSSNGPRAGRKSALSLARERVGGVPAAGLGIGSPDGREHHRRAPVLSLGSCCGEGLRGVLDHTPQLLARRPADGHAVRPQEPPPAVRRGPAADDDGVEAGPEPPHNLPDFGDVFVAFPFVRAGQHAYLPALVAQEGGHPRAKRKFPAAPAVDAPQGVHEHDAERPRRSLVRVAPGSFVVHEERGQLVGQRPRSGAGGRVHRHQPGPFLHVS